MKIPATLSLTMLLLLLLLAVAANFSAQASVIDVSTSCTSGRILKDEVGNEICDETALDTAAAAVNDDGGDDDLLDSASSFSESSYEAGIPAPLSQVDADAGSDFGEPQTIDPRYMDDIIARIAAAREYMQQKVQVEAKYDLVRHMCSNKNNNCAFWAVLGECENNPAYMHTNCAPVCQSCEMLHVDTRCPLDPDEPNALEPGDVNKMFERIATDPWFKQYQPVVLSRPDFLPGDTAENATYKIGLWMILFENAISDEEAERMIELGGLRGYERSKDVGDEREDGTYDSFANDGRTSTNAVRVFLMKKNEKSMLSWLWPLLTSLDFYADLYAIYSGVSTNAFKTQLLGDSWIVWRISLASQRPTRRTFSSSVTSIINSIKLTVTTSRTKKNALVASVS